MRDAADVGLVVGVELGERSEVVELRQQGRRAIHPLQIEGHVVLPRQVAREGVLPPLDEVAVLAFAGVEAGMRIGTHRADRRDGDVAGEQKVELVDQLPDIGNRCRAVEMSHVIGGINTRIGTAGTRDSDLRPQQGGESPVHRLLHGRLVGLALPAAVGPAQVS